MPIRPKITWQPVVGCLAQMRLVLFVRVPFDKELTPHGCVSRVALDASLAPLGHSTTVGRAACAWHLARDIQPRDIFVLAAAPTPYGDQQALHLRHSPGADRQAADVYVANSPSNSCCRCADGRALDGVGTCAVRCREHHRGRPGAAGHAGWG